MQLLSDNGGLIYVKKFLPIDQANWMQDVIKEVPAGAWYHSKYLEKKAWSTRHSFHRHHSTKLDKIKKYFEELSPDLILTIGASRYEPGNFIEEHDDLSGDTIKERVVSSSG